MKSKGCTIRVSPFMNPKIYEPASKGFSLHEPEDALHEPAKRKKR